MNSLKKEFGLTYVFISHDLGVVKYFSDRIAVMYLGKIVELGTSEELYKNPLHPYTRALISSIPVSDPRDRKEKVPLKAMFLVLFLRPLAVPFIQDVHLQKTNVKQIFLK